jgi:hypothetical protein
MIMKIGSGSLGSFFGIAITSMALQGAAQSQYSVNAVGYTDVNLVAGSNLLVNPFNAGDNSVSNVLRGVPDGTVFLRWDPPTASFPVSNVFHTATGWTVPEEKFMAPVGAFVSVPSPTQVTLVGDLAWPVGLPFGCFNYRAGLPTFTSMPQGYCGFCSSFDSCGGIPVPDGSTMCRWNAFQQDWNCYIYLTGPGGGWINAFGESENVQLALAEAALFNMSQNYLARMAFIPMEVPPVPEGRLFNWQREGNQLRFRVQGTNATGYTVLGCTNLFGQWSVVSSGIATSTNGHMEINLPAPTNHMAFYKLVGLSSPAVLINASRSGSQFQFQFYAATNATYTVQRKNSLAQPNWQTVTTITGNNSLKTVVDNGATAASGYYRLQY